LVFVLYLSLDLPAVPPELWQAGLCHLGFGI